MDRGAWWATVYRVAKSWTRLSDYTYLLTYLLTYLASVTFIFHLLGLCYRSCRSKTISWNFIVRTLKLISSSPHVTDGETEVQREVRDLREVMVLALELTLELWPSDLFFPQAQLPFESLGTDSDPPIS